MNEIVKEADGIFLKIDDTVAQRKNIIIKENISKPYAPKLKQEKGGASIMSRLGLDEPSSYSPSIIARNAAKKRTV